MVERNRIDEGIRKNLEPRLEPTTCKKFLSVQISLDTFEKLERYLRLRFELGASMDSEICARDISEFYLSEEEN